MFKTAEHWWLTPVILVIQKAEIRKIVVQSQTLSWKYLTQKGMMEWLRCRP
jgi:hypothetical protein